MRKNSPGVRIHDYYVAVCISDRISGKVSCSTSRTLRYDQEYTFR